MTLSMSKEIFSLGTFCFLRHRKMPQKIKCYILQKDFDPFFKIFNCAQYMLRNPQYHHFCLAVCFSNFHVNFLKMLFLTEQLKIFCQITTARVLLWQIKSQSSSQFAKVFIVFSKCDFKASQFQLFIVEQTTDYGHLVRKSPTLHG